MNRRRFVQSSVAGGLTLAVTPRALLGQAPTVTSSKSARPAVIASANGNKFKNGGDVTCVQKAFTMMTSGNADVLDALIAGVNIVELDPLDDSVGYGGLPNAEGVVQLDSCCMHGPKKRAGGVACIEGVRTPSLVAKAVMEQTDHHLIVGKGAQDFARGLGFKIEDDLNTEHSRELWLEWKRRIDPKHYLDPQKRAEAGRRALRAMVAEGLIDPQHIYGTINCDGINSKGEICGVTTTSGLSWKIPGRVGDSPIFGAGLYVDGEVGATGSTGRGEANLYGLCSFLIVENMRKGMGPKDAGMDALRRIKANTVEKRLLNSKGNPNFGISFYILNAKGEYAGLSMYPGHLKESTKEIVKSTYAVCTEKGAETLLCEALLEGMPED
ncbi:MAG TPA: N(4)-(beta-N-acetylglucosaminyl)-L-asparaginase [Chthoniobacterales bacterium]|nr:N(4)-(beta-N-acetylglucosaminyl)-L-asparaginase [Chthoniobacterales bacterium]